MYDDKRNFSSVVIRSPELLTIKLAIVTVGFLIRINRFADQKIHPGTVLIIRAFQTIKISYCISARIVYYIYQSQRIILAVIVEGINA